MEAQFQELAEKVTRDVAASVTAAVTQAVTVSVNAHVTTVVAQAEERLAEHLRATLDAAERRLSEQARINVEAVKEQATLAAEGYAATVESMNRRLDRMETAINNTLTDHTKVLADHSRRIDALEQNARP